MAEVVTNTQVILKVTDAEWRLIMKSLAATAGLQVAIKTDDQVRAAVLNKQLLVQRVSALQGALKSAEGALMRAEEGAGPEEGG